MGKKQRKGALKKNPVEGCREMERHLAKNNPGIRDGRGGQFSKSVGRTHWRRKKPGGP